MITGKFKKGVVALLLLISGVTASAGDFFFGLNAEGGNFWGNIPGIPVYFINNFLGGSALTTTYDWLRVSDSQGKIKVDQGNYFGFKAKDLFRQFGYGITFGYQPRYSVIGVYVTGNYHFKQFKMQPNRSIDAMEKYRLPGWSAGIGIRLTPFQSMLEEKDWSPIVEVGSTYRQWFSVKAPYGNDANQFGKGMTTRLSAGVRVAYKDGATGSITLGFDLPHYNFFNRDFEAPDGTHPYADIKSKNYGVSLSFKTEF